MDILNHLPDHSRVWIYTCNRAFNPNEVIQIEAEGKKFTDSWQVHGTDLVADMMVLYNHFIVFAVDEKVEAASGCSIDRSVGFIQSVEKEFNVVLLDKMNLAYRNNANEIEVEALPKFQELISSNKVSESTIVFNNLVENLGQMRSDWETTASNSWHKQLFL